MTLRRKTGFIVGATLTGLLVILYIVSRVIWLGGYEKLEEESTLRDVGRARGILSSRLDTLSGKTASARRTLPDVTVTPSTRGRLTSVIG